MAKYDPVLAALQERTSKSENSRIRYLSSSIQNELIGLAAKEVLKANLDLIKQSKVLLRDSGLHSGYFA